MLQHYHLGCPIWGNRRWAGTLYTRTARPADFLRQYAVAFNTVEGNTTFYSVPSPDMVARWVAETPDGFRFSFKFPRSITHDGRLVDADAEVGAFLKRLAPQIARRFHVLLAEQAAVGEMPPWPGEMGGDGAQPAEARQLGLFE